MHPHFVITYDSLGIVSNDAFYDEEVAMWAYFEAEERREGHVGLEVVMLSYTTDPTTSRVVKTVRQRREDATSDWLEHLVGAGGIRT